MDVDLGCSSYLARLLACLLEGPRWSTDHWAVGAAGYLPASRWPLVPGAGCKGAPRSPPLMARPWMDRLLPLRWGWGTAVLGGSRRAGGERQWEGGGERTDWEGASATQR